MPYYINIESKHKFFNKNSIPLWNQKVLRIESLKRYNQKKKKQNRAVVYRLFYFLLQTITYYIVLLLYVFLLFNFRTRPDPTRKN